MTITLVESTSSSDREHLTCVDTSFKSFCLVYGWDGCCVNTSPSKMMKVQKTIPVISLTLDANACRFEEVYCR